MIAKLRSMPDRLRVGLTSEGFQEQAFALLQTAPDAGTPQQVRRNTVLGVGIWFEA